MEVDESEVNLTQEVVWNEIAILKENLGKFKNVEISLLSSHLTNKYKMPNDETTNKILKYQLKKYKEANQKRIPPSKSVVLTFIIKKGRRMYTTK